MWTAIFIPCILAIGLLVAASFKWFGLDIDPKIKPGDVLNVFTTVFLALIIQNFWMRRMKRTEAENELVQSHIADASTAVRAIRMPILDALNRQPIPPNLSDKIVEAFENCTQIMATLEAVIENSHCENLLGRCKEISDLVLKYKNAITGGSFPNRKLTGSDTEQSSIHQQDLAKKLQLLSLDVRKT